MFVVATISGGLWLVTQAGMETCEIEIIEVSGLSFEGPNGSFDNFGSSLAVLRYRYLRPDDERRTRVNLFFSSTEKLNFELSGNADSVKFIEGSRAVFRYRKKPVLWMKADNLIMMSINEFGLSPNDIEEVISDYYFETSEQ